jgi:hypothetical protein
LTNAGLLVRAVIIKLARRREGGIEEESDWRGEALERKRLGREGSMRLFFFYYKSNLKHYNFTVTPAVVFKVAMCGGGGRKADSARFAFLGL